jgi:hypothetical protein
LRQILEFLPHFWSKVKFLVQASTGSVFASNSGVFASLLVKSKVLSTGSVFASNSGLFASLLVKSKVLRTGSVFA